MRYSHSDGGIIGITLKLNALKVWALSRHICCKVESDLMELGEGETEATRLHLHHKEELKVRIETDATNRAGLRQKLETCIDPMNLKNHREAS